MVRSTNNDFLFRSSKKKALTNVCNIRESVGDILCGSTNAHQKPKRTNDIWTSRRIISAILMVHNEYKKRKSAGENIRFNTSFFSKSIYNDAQYFTKKNLTELALRIFGDEIDNKKGFKDLDLRGFIELALPKGVKKEEILADFEKGWSPKRARAAVIMAYEEYLEKKIICDTTVFNSSFFMNSKQKDVKNLTKKLKSFAKSAFGEKAKNIKNLRDFISLSMEDCELKEQILQAFVKSK